MLQTPQRGVDVGGDCICVSASASGFVPVSGSVEAIEALDAVGIGLSRSWINMVAWEWEGCIIVVVE